MCGRYTLGANSDRVRERFGVEQQVFAIAPRYDIVPSQHVAAVVRGEDGGCELRGFKWGLVPSWSNEEDMSHRLINARAETLDEKPSFKPLLASRRCIIPASGFFEGWKHDGQTIPVHVCPKDGDLWGLAGLWDEWESESGFFLRTCTIVTTEPNCRLAPLHRRMPAVLRRGDEAKWLNPKTPAPEALRLLQPYPAKAMEIYAVSRNVKWMASSDARRIEPDENAPDLPEATRSTGETRAKLILPKRVVRRNHVSPDGQVFFTTRSFTRDDYTRWHPVVDTRDGHVFCDCPDFRFRHAMHDPDLETPHHWCKHLMRAVDNCRRHGEVGV